jgi:hypothetical protein
MLREGHWRALERRIISKTMDIITPGDRQCKPDVVDYDLAAATGTSGVGADTVKRLLEP